MRPLKIGVLALQGAAREHLSALQRCGAEAVPVRRREQLAELDGLVLPGGESTTIGKLVMRYGLADPIRELAASGKALFGTCAGMILLARAISGSDQFCLGLLDIEVMRNAFGRQRESFEADLAVPVLGEEPFCALFIRAPLVEKVGEKVQVLATYEERVVAARQGRVLVASFHPELTTDLRLHRYFLSLAREAEENGKDD
jgi:5'-phosphate synthase pdxT subunit